MLKIGIYSGTFDPIHNGHLDFARSAMEICELDKIVFLPERKPRNKQYVTDISHRVHLIEQATETIASSYALTLNSEQFTVDSTLSELQSIFNHARLTLLIGSDVVRNSLHKWNNLDMLFDQVSFAIGIRSDDISDEITKMMVRLGQEQNITPRYTCIRTTNSELASSRIKSHLTNMSWLPNPKMLDYIQYHQLYPQLTERILKAR